MDFRFSTDDWVGIQPDERARRCRLMAEQAWSLAQSASSLKFKTVYSRIATEWEELADEIESQVESEPRLNQHR
jgi:hypothetical protein